ncbi:hypothetical protein O6P43_014632 [Quillaja saponaria]|uniref:Uncharacterized protein n=1 Tax=Quillaja saponaria TaxID=32244 RepID=A0AAD7LV39_QUISA|nr:hypothetical protein O6P43_014632 [Quillaja saponaria]
MAASTHHQVDEQELETIRVLRFVDTKQSDEKLKSTFSYFGYIYLAKIINNSDKVVDVVFCIVAIKLPEERGLMGVG